jgi:hypothetical protein
MHSTQAARKRRHFVSLVFLGVAVAVAVVAVAWLLARSDGTTQAAPAPNTGPALVSRGQLEQLASPAGHPVYWAGPKAGFSYELTSTANGRVFVRYLPAGVEAGDTRPDFLVVGTYSRAGAFADLKRAATREGAVSVGLDHGGLVVFAAKGGKSVYFGYPNDKYQVEVFAPSSETARKLVLSGKITPIR